MADVQITLNEFILAGMDILQERDGRSPDYQTIAEWGILFYLRHKGILADEIIKRLHPENPQSD